MSASDVTNMYMHAFHEIVLLEVLSQVRIKLYM